MYNILILLCFQERADNGLRPTLQHIQDNPATVQGKMFNRERLIKFNFAEHYWVELKTDLQLKILIHC